MAGRGVSAGTLAVNIIAKTDQFSKGIKKAQRDIRDLGHTATGFAATLGKVGGAFTGIGAAALAASVGLKRFSREAKSITRELREAKGLGLSFQDFQFAKFASGQTGLTVKDITARGLGAFGSVRDDFNAMGGGISNKTAANMERWSNATEKLGLAMESLKNEMAEVVVPTLVSAIEDLTWAIGQFRSNSSASRRSVFRSLGKRFPVIGAALKFMEMAEDAFPPLPFPRRSTPAGPAPFGTPLTPFQRQPPFAGIPGQPISGRPVALGTAGMPMAIAPFQRGAVRTVDLTQRRLPDTHGGDVAGFISSLGQRARMNPNRMLGAMERGSQEAFQAERRAEGAVNVGKQQLKAQKEIVRGINELNQKMGDKIIIGPANLAGVA